MWAAQRTRSMAPDWLSRAIIAGFAATAMMTFTLMAAYLIAAAFGDPTGGTLARWLWGLTHNPVETTSRAFIAQALGIHLAVGLIFAVVYAYFFAPVLPGPPAVRGMLFSLGPWLLSLVVLLPLLGGGFFGANLQAGPLPVLGNLILHLVYGATLGWTYSLGGSVWTEDVGRRPEERAAFSGESTLAIGIVAGAVLGGLIGWLVGVALAPFLTPGVTPSSTAEFALVGALFGAAAGAIAGPYVGLGTRAR